MPEWSWTGDPAVDQLILSNLSNQYAQSYNRAKGQLGESLTARGFGGLGGLYDQQLTGLIGERTNLEGQAATGAAMAHVQRIQEQRRQEQELQNQMRLLDYQAKLGQPKKRSRYGAALSGAGTGAAVGNWAETAKRFQAPSKSRIKTPWLPIAMITTFPPPLGRIAKS